jgi:aspartate aminotransferase/aminotransferase
MDAAWKLESEGKRVFHLEVGQPMCDPPMISISRTQSSVAEKKMQRYIENAGLVELRETVSKYFNNRFNQVKVVPSNVFISHGAVGALATAFMSVIEAGDEVLLPDPAWPNYDMAVRIVGGVPRRYGLKSNDSWRLDMDSLKSAVSSKTKAIVICTPSNPVRVKLQ